MEVKKLNWEELQKVLVSDNSPFTTLKRVGSQEFGNYILYCSSSTPLTQSMDFYIAAFIKLLPGGRLKNAFVEEIGFEGTDKKNYVAKVAFSYY